MPVEGRSVREKEVGDPASQKGSRTKSRQREIEDIPREPVGQPEVLGPKKLEPLFDAEQVRKAEELSAQAPMLQGQKAPSGARVLLGWGEINRRSSWVSSGKGVGGSGKGFRVDASRSRGTGCEHASASTHVSTTPRAVDGSPGISSYERMDGGSDESSSPNATGVVPSVSYYEVVTRRESSFEGSTDGGKGTEVFHTPRW